LLRLIIAEKPSMAADIAKALGGFQRRQGYYSRDDYWLTWAVGHLLQLAPPEAYRPEWKSWRAVYLPMAPGEFKLVPISKAKPQLHTIGKLLQSSQVSECINACDAGREGELIFRYILDFWQCVKPQRRLWVSSLTASAIRQGFAVLEQQPVNQERYELLFQAARCRSQADWLVGINATRALTVRQRQMGGRELYSLGRVQTPTLALLVERELEIAAFEPRPFWQLVAIFAAIEEEYEGHWFRGEEDRLWSAAELQELVDKLQGGGLPVVAKVESYTAKERRESPPLLYDLTSLQRDANRRFGFNASRTLRAAQKLYEERKLISYPRSDARYLTPDLIPSLPRRLQAGVEGSPYALYAQELLALPQLPVSGRLVNPSKVRDHHAIIPTETKVPWAGISGDERRILELVQQSFVAAFMAPALWLDQEIITSCREELFRSKASRLLEPGWRRTRQRTAFEESSGEEGGEQSLPLLQVGDEVWLTALKGKEGVTKAPPRFSEGSLLTAMERAGANLDDEALQEALKDSGLGTAATRAAIIDRLKEVMYISEEGRALVPTPKGIALIRDLPVAALRSAELTGNWEAKLAKVERGELTALSFMEELLIFLGEVTASCLEGKLLDTQQATAIYNQARQTLSGGTEASPLPAKAAPRRQRGSGGQSSRRRAGKSASQAATSILNGSTASIFPNNDSKEEAQLNCPLCGQPLRQNSKSFYCSRWNSSPPCSFTVWKVVAGKTLTAKQIATLVSKGKTRTLKGFRSQQGKPFAAALVIKEGKVSLEFANSR